MNNYLLKCENINKFYQEGENQTQVLKGVSFSMEPAELVAIVGSSGSGKSTLLHTLGGLDQPSSGEVFINGQSLQKTSANELSALRNRYLGFVYQFHHLMADFTALENVMLAQHYHSVIDEAAAKAVLEQVGLGHRIDHRPSQLSGGEQQRVCIARALVNQPPVIFADEPTGNLDEKNEALVLDLLQELNRQGRTIVMVTHNPELGELTDRVIYLHHGKFVKEDINEK